MVVSLALDPRRSVSITVLAARREASVSAVIAEALATYLADVATGLLTGPQAEPRYVTRLRARGK